MLIIIFSANNTGSKPSHRFIPSDDEEEEEEEDDDSEDDDEEEPTINHKVSKPIVANKPKSSNQAAMPKNKGKAPHRVPQPSDDEDDEDEDEEEQEEVDEEKKLGMYSPHVGSSYQTILNKEINRTRRPPIVCSSYVYIKTT